MAITPDVVAAYRDRQLDENKSRDTVRLQLALLSHIFEIAIKEWRIGLWANPCRAIRAPKPGKPRDRRLSPDEEQRLIAAAENQSNPFTEIRLALATAMRVGEIQRLRRPDVDPERRIAILRDTKNNQARAVPLSSEAVGALREALNNPARPIDCDLIFFGEPGRDGTRSGFEYGPSWRRAKREAGIANLWFHDLRHEAASRLVELRLSNQEVAAVSAACRCCVVIRICGQRIWLAGSTRLQDGLAAIRLGASAGPSCVDRTARGHCCDLWSRADVA